MICDDRGYNRNLPLLSRRGGGGRPTIEEESSPVTSSTSIVTAHGVWQAKKRRANKNGRNRGLFLLTFSSLFLYRGISMLSPSAYHARTTCWAP